MFPSEGIHDTSHNGAMYDWGMVSPYSPDPKLLNAVRSPLVFNALIVLVLTGIMGGVLVSALPNCAKEVALALYFVGLAAVVTSKRVVWRMSVGWRGSNEEETHSRPDPRTVPRAATESSYDPSCVSFDSRAQGQTCVVVRSVKRRNIGYITLRRL
jgi:hypothetical protein